MKDGSRGKDEPRAETAALSAWLESDVRSYELIFQVFAQCARAMANAHAKDVVYRDFTPNNIRVTTTKDPNGVARVTAKVVTSSTSSRIDNAYTAPEQFDGRERDARADQFAFFVSLFETLAKKRPFPGGETPTALREAMASGIEDSALPKSIAPSLRAFIVKGLAEKPTSRHASMEDVASFLEKVVAPAQRTLPAIVAMAVAAIVIVGMFFLASQRGDTTFSGNKPIVITPECRALGLAIGAGLSKEDETPVRAAFDQTKDPNALVAQEHFLGIVRDRIVAIDIARREMCLAPDPKGEVECLRVLHEDVLDVLKYGRSVKDRAGLEGAIVAARSLDAPAICKGARPDPSIPTDAPYMDRDEAITQLLFEIPQEIAPTIPENAERTKRGVLSMLHVLRVRVKEPAAFTGDAAPLLTRAAAGAESLRLAIPHAELLVLQAESTHEEPNEALTNIVSHASYPLTNVDLDLLLATRAAEQGHVRRMPSLEQALSLDLTSRVPFAPMVIDRGELSRGQTRSEIEVTIATAEAAWGNWHSRTATAYLEAAEWEESRNLKPLAVDHATKAATILRASIASPSRRTGIEAIVLARALSILAVFEDTNLDARAALLAEADALAKGTYADAIAARPHVIKARLELDQKDATRAAADAMIGMKDTSTFTIVTRAEATALLAEATFLSSKEGDFAKTGSIFKSALDSAALLSPRDRARLNLLAAKRLMSSKNPGDQDAARDLARQAANEAPNPADAEKLLRSLPP